jgi:hypothetical protein
MNFRHVFSGDLDELNTWGTWAMGGHMDHHGLMAVDPRVIEIQPGTCRFSVAEQATRISG